MAQHRAAAHRPDPVRAAAAALNTTPEGLASYNITYRVESTLGDAVWCGAGVLFTSLTGGLSLATCGGIAQDLVNGVVSAVTSSGSSPSPQASSTVYSPIPVVGDAPGSPAATYSPVPISSPYSATPSPVMVPAAPAIDPSQNQTYAYQDLSTATLSCPAGSVIQASSSRCNQPQTLEELRQWLEISCLI